MALSPRSPLSPLSPLTPLTPGATRAPLITLRTPLIILKPRHASPKKTPSLPPQQQPRPFTNTEKTAITALSSPNASLQAYGYDSIRSLFPESELYRLQQLSTQELNYDMLKRYQAIFPKDRYGVLRDKPIYEDEKGWFRDLDVVVGLKIREGRIVLKDDDDDDSDGDEDDSKLILERQRRKKQYKSRNMVNPSDYEFDVQTTAKGDGENTGHSKIDIFTHRLQNMDDSKIGKSHYLAHCRQLSTVPNAYYLDNVTRTHLDFQHFGLSPSAIICIGKGLETNTSITHLNLTSNKAGDLAITSLLDSLCFNPSISSLILSENSLNRGDATARLLGSISKAKSLYRLDLSSNALDDTSAILIAQALVGNKTLEVLDLSSNAFGGIGGMSIFKAVGGNGRLTSLNLSDNKLSVSERMMTSSSSKIRTPPNSSASASVNVSGSGAAVVRSLKQSLTDMKDLQQNLHTLIISSNLITLQLRNCNMGDSLGLAMTKVLLTKPHPLKILDISGNKLTSTSGIALSQALATNNALEHLNVSRNSLGLQSTLSIIDALAYCGIISLEINDTTGNSGVSVGVGDGVGEIDNERKREMYGVSKGLIDKAKELMERWEVDEGVRRDAEAAAAAGGGENGTMANGKGKKKKKEKPKAKKAEGKKAKKGKIEAEDKSPIPKRFFDEAALFFQTSKTSPSKTNASRRSISPLSSPTLPVSLSVSTAVNPLSWQMKMSDVEKENAVSMIEELSVLFWKRVERALRKRKEDGGRGCVVEAESIRRG